MSNNINLKRYPNYSHAIFDKVEYDDTIKNMLCNKKYEIKYGDGKSYVQLYFLRCHLITDENEISHKYFISHENSKNYTWENMRIFFDFDI
jgi:hypothetical protein